MQDRNFNLHDGKTGSAITVRITPRSSRNEVSEILDDGTVKIRLTAAQNEEKLNQALVAFLAQILDVDAKQIEIVAGLSGNDKLVTIVDLDKSQVQEGILRHLS